ncbi:MAG: hypothetical protein ABR599_05635 [Gemmatimonadota bacterium]
MLLLPRDVLAEMNALFTANNSHWDELADLTTLEQMLGTIKPTQREYLGCLQGTLEGDTLRIRGWGQARDLKQLQFAVDGSCEHIADVVGTWHTHPFRADPGGCALKERSLSALDLATFSRSTDGVSVVVWDVDSLDVALRGADGRMTHPAHVALR